MENSQRNLNSDLLVGILYCNTVESFEGPKICKIFKYCMDELLQIATKEKFCEANFREHQNFIPFNFTNKLWLRILIFEVMYYFEWSEIQ